ncbi:MAG: phosphoglucosamine mutase, partial [Oscillospiraceae bacterium]|nr:phosphoglucosamine mutase [Oscillospiraceae bacterium]
GIMISASHNPYTDNGIKLINADGEKMEEDLLNGIEAYIDSDEQLPYATGADIGCTIDYAAGRNRYIGYLITLATRSYKGMRVGLDCANGSTWMMAKSVFDALGADTHVIANDPDGLNINVNCGSTHIENLRSFVVANNLDVGFAFDGDADRCLAVDEKGNVVNGDHILYLSAKYLQERGKLGDSKVVTTIMSNMGLYKALDELGIGYEKTPVGDKYVAENMKKNGHLIGGEQSGHIIFSQFATTGDGVLTAIKVMEAMTETKQPLSKLTEGMKMYPQKLKNVIVDDKDGTLADEAVRAEVKKVEAELGTEGRVVLRKSGTEPLLRVMVEAGTQELCEEKVDQIIAAMKTNGHLIRVK